MLIQNRTAIDRFARKHANCRIPFAEWTQKVEAALWDNLVDVKATFNSADYVTGLVVFNVGGNNYRVVTEIVFKEKIVRIAKGGTHAEYDGWNL